MQLRLMALVISLCVSSTGIVHAHSGRTDSKGGHLDRKAGTYHYHNSGIRRSTSRVTQPQKPATQTSDTEYSLGLKRADRMGYDVWGDYFYGDYFYKDNGDSKITAEDAVNHIGQIGVVCGKVESTHYAENSRGSPTYLNLGKPYPDQVFTVVIWGRYRQKFDKPEQTYRGKQICVRGKITEYQGIPQIEVVEKEYISMARMRY